MTLAELRAFVDLAEKQGISLNSQVKIITNTAGPLGRINGSNIHSSITGDPVLGIEADR